jgi:mono/diheme cytochrome c family protein
MNVNIRVIILSTFVVTLLLVLILRTCSAPPNKGELVYQNNCASCHGADGEGFNKLIPPLTDSAWLAQNSDRFACIIVEGINEEITINGQKFHQPMYGINQLNDVEIANVGNYIYKRWSDPNIKFNAKQIEKALMNCE